MTTTTLTRSCVSLYGTVAIVNTLIALSVGASLTSSADYVEVPTVKKPVVGAYAKNFKGAITSVLSETGDSSVTLPHLNVEDNFYFGRTLQLNCNATFPVQWVYRGNGTPAVHSETFRMAPEFMNIDSYLFQASVVFTYTDPKQTGNYTCEGVNRPELQTYLYVYVPGNTTIFVLDSTMKHTVEVDASKRNEWTTIPCMVTDPKAKIQLYKISSDVRLERVELSETVKFDPTIGFSMKTSSPFGQYICAAGNEYRREKLRINVKAFKEADKDNELQTEIEPLSITYDAKQHRLLCCNNKALERPNIKSVNCESVSDCNIKNNYLRRKKCQGICEEHVMPVNGSCVAFELFETREAGIVECYYKDHVAFNQFSKEQDVIITDFNEMPPIEDVLMVHMEEVSSSAPRNRYVCHANSFYFSTGLKMAWENSDGSLDFINETSFPLSNTVEIDATGHNLTRLFCFAPVWNSATEWRNVSVYVD